MCILMYHYQYGQRGVVLRACFQIYHVMKLEIRSLHYSATPILDIGICKDENSQLLKIWFLKTYGERK